MAKNYFDRYVWLLNVINDYGPITFKEISRRWAYSLIKGILLYMRNLRILELPILLKFFMSTVTKNTLCT